MSAVVTLDQGLPNLVAIGRGPYTSRHDRFFSTPDRWSRRKIGIGGCLAEPPSPHHLAYGSVPRRFDRVKLGRAHRFEGDRASRNSCCAAPVGPTGRTVDPALPHALEAHNATLKADVE